LPNRERKLPVVKSLWKEVRGPSAGLVQRHYVAARQEQFLRGNPTLVDQVREVFKNIPALRTADFDDAYARIRDNLQSAELTINLKAEDWFGEDKIETTLRYDSYSQMYERSVGDSGQPFLKDSQFNTGEERAKVDDAITFPAGWSQGNGAAPRNRSHAGLQNAMVSTDRWKQSPSGLKPGAPSGERIMNQMAFGGRAPMLNRDGTKYEFDDKGVTRSGVQSQNPHFNPATKQVFAALNYGKRPHGSSIHYGDSFLIFDDRLKVNAMYYPGDTFGLPLDTSTQTPFQMLGAILLHANNVLRREIVASCYNNQRLEDSSDGADLLEAHLFEKISYHKHLKAVCIPVRYRGSKVHNGAKRFASKFGVELRLVS
jgi:hypothetical protein